MTFKQPLCLSPLLLDSTDDNFQKRSKTASNLSKSCKVCGDHTCIIHYGALYVIHAKRFFIDMVLILKCVFRNIAIRSFLLLYFLFQIAYFTMWK
jgi:hypothetical protein